MIFLYDIIVASSSLIVLMCFLFTLSHLIEGEKRIRDLKIRGLVDVFKRKPVRGTFVIVSFCSMIATMGTAIFPVEITYLFLSRTAFLRIFLIIMSISVFWGSVRVHDLENRIRIDIEKKYSEKFNRLEKYIKGE